MRKCLALLCTLLLLPCLSLAEETLPPLAFFGVELGAPLSEACAVWDCTAVSGAEDEYYHFRLADMTDRQNYVWNEVPNEEPCPEVFLVAQLRSDEVAGYAPNLTCAFFIRPVTDGVLSSSEEDALLYAGYYDFWSVPDTKAMADDLTAKLNGLYGPAGETGKVDWYKAGTKTVWHVGDSAAIVLNTYPDNRNVRLSYVLLNADELIEAACAAVPSGVEPTRDPASTNGL